MTIYQDKLQEKEINLVNAQMNNGKSAIRLMTISVEK